MLADLAKLLLGTEPKIKLIVILIAMAGLAALWPLVSGYINRTYRTSWYDPTRAGWNKPVSWREVKRLMSDDPKNYVAVYRFPCGDVARDIIIITSVFMLIYLLYRAMYYWDGSLEDLKDISIVLGAFSLVATIFGVLYQGRLQARAANRQIWINELRKEINTLISNFPSKSSGAWKIQSSHKKYDETHVRLELYLNPNERVHRGFMAVVRFMYGVDGLQIDKEARNKLNIPNSRIEGDNCLSLDDADWDLWKSNAIRLANVLLKREWEQVKHVK